MEINSSTLTDEIMKQRQVIDFYDSKGQLTLVSGVKANEGSETQPEKTKNKKKTQLRSSYLGEINY